MQELLKFTVRANLQHSDFEVRSAYLLSQAICQVHLKVCAKADRILDLGCSEMQILLFLSGFMVANILARLFISHP